MTNILILSAGTRNKVVQAFRTAFEGEGNVIATDCSNLAPAIYEADRHYLVPRITAPDYTEHILSICREEKITGVFSLIDPELSLLAKERERFLEIGTTPVVSPYELVETCFDKYAFYEMMKEYGIPSACCFKDKEEFYRAKDAGKIAYPVFVKPIRGSASIHINKVESDQQIETLFAMYEDLMIQEYMPYQEYGADVYIDMITGKCVSVFLKKKIRMRAGETDKSVSVMIPELTEKIVEFTEKAGFRGMIDIDIFYDKDRGIFYFSEVNPRFGGGYPHAYACGVDMPKLLLNNLKGIPNEPSPGDYRTGVCMMKYNEICIRDITEEEIII
ncbi:MAG: ATP-grasp domain-containing protein [Lachnospiraceae bacterium]|nr:ATP-grasp domain-containing protein [Lachnospiraceae bacterium]